MNLSDVPKQNDEVAARRIDGLFYIVDADSSELHNLNGVGSRIYELVDGKRSVADIVEVIVSEYDVTTFTAERDVRAFLDLLRAKSLLSG